MGLAVCTCSVGLCDVVVPKDSAEIVTVGVLKIPPHDQTNLKTIPAHAQTTPSGGLCGFCPILRHDVNLGVAQTELLDSAHIAINYDDWSEDDVETNEEVKWFSRKRRFAVSSEGISANNKAAVEMKGHIENMWSKTKEECCVIEDALMKSVLLSDLEKPLMEQLIESMAVETVDKDIPIVKQCDMADEVIVVLSGCVTVDGDDESTFVKAGGLLDEIALLWCAPHPRSAVAVTRCRLARLTRCNYREIVVSAKMEALEQRMTAVKKAKLLETFDDEQLMKLAQAFDRRTYEPKQDVIVQGEAGNELFVVESGECSVRIKTGTTVQEHRHYLRGDLFGELALLNNKPRAASVTAEEHSVVLALKRSRFERLLGSLSSLRKERYEADPRKRIADFYKRGDGRGPRGVLKMTDASLGEQTSWFSVFRPTSRDAIQKMLSGCAVGKGLNVKGKSAKRNYLSGFVPFVQISDNDHKDDIEVSPPDSRILVYFKTELARSIAKTNLEQIRDKKTDISMDNPSLIFEDQYAPSTYGLDVPEALFMYSYVTNPDVNLIPPHGWETGRGSEPAFMDMNLHAIRDDKPPKVVVLQYNENDPMCPQGLLVAYAEEHVKPVVSDFDAFTVGSKCMKYNNLSEDQSRLARWSLEKCEDIFAKPGPGSWTTRWLRMLKEESKSGFTQSVQVPTYGFGDSVSYDLTEKIVGDTRSSGAIRHGAECFNFFFPQELDDNYLVVWDGFTAGGNDNEPWLYLSEKELRVFLLERVAEGFAFPLNPVWPVRDEGWWEVFEALINNPVTKSAVDHWFPSGGIIELMRDIRARSPDGFEIVTPKKTLTRYDSISFSMESQDQDNRERADYALHDLKKYQKTWARSVRKINSVRTLMKLSTKMKSSDSAPKPAVTPGSAQESAALLADRVAAF